MLQVSTKFLPMACPGVIVNLLVLAERDLEQGNQTQLQPLNRGSLLAEDQGKSPFTQSIEAFPYFVRELIPLKQTQNSNQSLTILQAELSTQPLCTRTRTCSSGLLISIYSTLTCRPATLHRFVMLITRHEAARK
jgi:hypothetical protein